MAKLKSPNQVAEEEAQRDAEVRRKAEAERERLLWIGIAIFLAVVFLCGFVAGGILF